ncbi:high mobility group B protein 6 [Canna indica]|uniref:High mobility group B protein 6 n=1 Tax=Canna indica TaxID=4628 RepID=A0AAQ3QH47_9LILI|nr:high mobility group B protein 6 [Canna indica]
MDSPVTAATPLRRKPLQSKNFDPASAPPLRPKPKLFAIRILQPIGGSAGKENQPILASEPAPEPKKHLVKEAEPEPEPNVGPREASLGEELAAIRKRRERLREERERTEKELREKDAMMQRWELELDKRAEEQRSLDLELRLLIKLQDLRSSSMIFSPVQSLREQEQQKSMEMQIQMSPPIISLREKERQKNIEVQLQEPQSAEEISEVDEASSIQENGTEY